MQQHPQQGPPTSQQAACKVCRLWQVLVSNSTRAREWGGSEGDSWHGKHLSSAPPPLAPPLTPPPPGMTQQESCKLTGAAKSSHSIWRNKVLKVGTMRKEGLGEDEVTTQVEVEQGSCDTRGCKYADFEPFSPKMVSSAASAASAKIAKTAMPAGATQQFVPLHQHQFARPAPLPYNSSSASLMSVTQQPTPDAAYAPAHCATVISEAVPVLAVAHNLVPGSLKEIFTTHVMCDYTPRVPGQFVTSRWATLDDLVSKLQQHAPAEVTKLGHQNLRQMITEWYRHHPAFENLPFTAWVKRLKNNAPQASARSLTFKFCFEHTPGGLGR